jgi:glutamine amidotransferase
MTVAIIDYGSGNLRSAAKALERAARESGAGGPVVVTADSRALASADRIVLPGVGAFADCRRGLAAIPGMIEALAREAIGRAKPFLGICVGMQLMAEIGREHVETPGFGWIKGAVEAIKPADPALKVPHMGWNDLIVERAHPVLDGIESGEHAYFVHGFHFLCAHGEDRMAHVDYGGPITAAVARDNLFGTQFHPEKSQAAGLRLLANFLRWRP